MLLAAPGSPPVLKNVDGVHGDLIQLTWEVCQLFINMVIKGKFCFLLVLPKVSPVLKFGLRIYYF